MDIDTYYAMTLAASWPFPLVDAVLSSGANVRRRILGLGLIRYEPRSRSGHHDRVSLKYHASYVWWNCAWLDRILALLKHSRRASSKLQVSKSADLALR